MAEDEDERGFDPEIDDMPDLENIDIPLVSSCCQADIEISNRIIICSKCGSVCDAV